MFFCPKSNSLCIRAGCQLASNIGSRNAGNEHLFVARDRAAHDLHGIPSAPKPFGQELNERLVGRRIDGRRRYLNLPCRLGHQSRCVKHEAELSGQSPPLPGGLQPAWQAHAGVNFSSPGSYLSLVKPRCFATSSRNAAMRRWRLRFSCSRNHPKMGMVRSSIHSQG